MHTTFGVFSVLRKHPAKQENDRGMTINTRLIMYLFASLVFVSFLTASPLRAESASCFWLSRDGVNNWLPFKPLSKQKCSELDKCALGGRCMKWSLGANGPPHPFDKDAFSGKAAEGCGQPSSRSCWTSAATNAVNACKSSGCGTCTTPINANDNCAFAGGYICNSICK